MEYYCCERPHQALFGFTPADFDAIGNKSQFWGSIER
jgi:hypothetical protein